MKRQGTCKGVQDAAAARIGAVPASQPFRQGAPATGSEAKRSVGIGPNSPYETSLLHTGKGTCTCAAPSPRDGDVPFLLSQQSQYLPFLFQTARVEVGRLVKED